MSNKIRGGDIDHADLDELGAHIRAGLPEAELLVFLSRHGELTLQVRREDLPGVLKFARDDSQCRFESLIDICGVDYPERKERFEIVYHLLSMRMNQRLRVKARASEDDSVPSAVELFPAAGWFEREAFDMYGIKFSSHPDLRRILTDYGFEGFPLRKDFPLSGHVQVRYDLDRARVVQEPVYLSQEYRDFDFASPWEGGGYIKEPGETDNG